MNTTRFAFPVRARGWRAVPSPSRHARWLGALGAGILARLMPALQVFFVLMPANIGIGLILFAMLLTMMMGLYLTGFEHHLAMWRG